MAQVWAGVDTGKTHHCVVIDHDSRRLLSRRVANDEQELLALLAAMAELAGQDQLTWAVDQADGGAALLIGLLLGHDQRLLYLPGRTVNRAAAGSRGEGKTDARDAAIIADQARMRRDLTPLRPGDAHGDLLGGRAGCCGRCRQPGRMKSRCDEPAASPHVRISSIRSQQAAQSSALGGSVPASSSGRALLDVLGRVGPSRMADSGGIRLAFEPAVLALDRIAGPI